VYNGFLNLTRLFYWCGFFLFKTVLLVEGNESMKMEVV